MRGSFQIAKVFDIPVQLHWSFGLIFVGILYLGYQDKADWATIGLWTLLVLALFFCVLLHEFGHALTARRFGVRTRDIILSPIGGVARLERLPEKPIHEFYVAIAGPMVNLAVMGILAPYFLFVSSETIEKMQGILLHLFGIQTYVSSQNMPPLDSFLFFLITLNGTLAVFNMLPAFPMDGGRVLRALLSMRIGRLNATRIAVYIGQMLAILLAIYGSIWEFNPIIIFIGIFVFFAASNEFRMVRIEKVLDSHRVADVLRVQFTKFYASDPMELPAAELKRGLEKNFIIFDAQNEIKGILQEQDILKAVNNNTLETPIDPFIQSKFESISADTSLKTVFIKMQANDYAICPVENEEGRILGVIDARTMYDFLRIHDKIKPRAVKRNAVASES